MFTLGPDAINVYRKSANDQWLVSRLPLAVLQFHSIDEELLLESLSLPFEPVRLVIELVSRYAGED